MSSLTSFLKDQSKELDRLQKEQVEVIAETLEKCVQLAASHLRKKPHEIDYIVLKRGKKKLFGSEPWHIRASIVPEDNFLDELSELDQKLTGGSGKLVSKDLKEFLQPKDKDGRILVQILRNGVYLTVFPPSGEGRAVEISEVSKKLSVRGVDQVDDVQIRKLVKEAKGEPTYISNMKARPGMEAKLVLDVAMDRMKAKVTLVPPKPGGRDLEVRDVINYLKNAGIKYGIKEDEIQRRLEEEFYNQPFTAAEGDLPINGKNATITYRVRTQKNVIFREDESGRVDYKDMDLIENVVVGQLLAEKIPAEKGKYGRTLFNELLPAKDGLDTELKQGKGTILSDDRTKLTAEVNGQVVYAAGRLSVETVYRVNGDVGIKTGNVTFLGSVIITGNVEDNYSVKAAGNIEIYGTVQKANVEADGDIIIRQGVSGRDEARIESTGGNVIAKFIQNATVITEKDVIVQEGILHCFISAGGKVVSNGKRGQIVGGTIRAAELIAAKVIGSSANPPTELVVGTDPKVLKQIADYEEKLAENQGKFEQLTKSLKTLKARKESDPASFTQDHEQQLAKTAKAVEKLETRVREYDNEIQNLQNYMEDKAANGKICIEKTLYGGVTLKIRNSDFKTRNEIKHKTFVEENGVIRQLPYQDPEPEKKDWRKNRSRVK
ncbi:PF03961 family protein [Leptospira broomii serovar Hurstbridge str. 5399]|uniref:PF03961 family protein n=1 Tax=Leptospira broomii serovar Hurstbridge str. 5399 TaxID=1049789 RepID=T0FGI2_9LEPT|nr:FapA family protein [Leptospira broomii]EQA46717.1 PF03961 family protein [Leptospira broomii serovar Hurstbridge str. 5399]